ncbi:MAG: Zn-dependent hydrolase [Chloroflexi bacterium]|nr:Zn-dependent hydrolase [Chloroflexota bacterium]
MLDAIAEIGTDPTAGVSRLAFTAAERQAHELVSGWLRELGLTVRQDAIGNTIAERPGTVPGAKAIGVGSHLDSVPHGGRFDGIVGVVGAVEMVRLLSVTRRQLQHTLRVVLFAGEEGARFGEPCIGSKAVVGAFAGRDLGRILDAQGVSLASALQDVGLDPVRISAARWDPREWAAFLELHVEQARLLESEGRQVGLVDVVSGSTRLRLTLHGRADHSGGTPMDVRADALVAAADVVVAAEGLATDPRHRGTRATVGRLDVYPNSITTIPGRVTLTVDVRDVDSDRQRAAAAEITQIAAHICQRRGVRLEAEVIADTSPAVLPMWLREITSAVCRELGIDARPITSGAGHDAQVVNQLVPAGMIFVPSREGLSHVPEEWTSASDIARGVEVLYHSVLRLDGFLTEMSAEIGSADS